MYVSYMNWSSDLLECNYRDRFLIRTAMRKSNLLVVPNPIRLVSVQNSFLWKTLWNHLIRFSCVTSYNSSFNLLRRTRRSILGECLHFCGTFLLIFLLSMHKNNSDRCLRNKFEQCFYTFFGIYNLFICTCQCSDQWTSTRSINEISDIRKICWIRYTAWMLSHRSTQFIHEFLLARYKYATVVARVELCRITYFVLSETMRWILERTLKNQIFCGRLFCGTNFDFLFTFHENFNRTIK